MDESDTSHLEMLPSISESITVDEVITSFNDMEAIEKIIDKDIKRQLREREYSKRYYEKVKKTYKYKEMNKKRQHEFYRKNRELVCARAKAKYHERKLIETILESNII